MSTAGGLAQGCSAGQSLGDGSQMIQQTLSLGSFAANNPKGFSDAFEKFESDLFALWTLDRNLQTSKTCKCLGRDDLLRFLTFTYDLFRSMLRR
jgi:hypothetical protein